jgi:hypothetical protein
LASVLTSLGTRTCRHDFAGTSPSRIIEGWTESKSR